MLHIYYQVWHVWWFGQSECVVVKRHKTVSNFTLISRNCAKVTFSRYRKNIITRRKGLGKIRQTPSGKRLSCKSETRACWYKILKVEMTITRHSCKSKTRPIILLVKENNHAGRIISEKTAMYASFSLLIKTEIIFFVNKSHSRHSFVTIIWRHAMFTCFICAAFHSDQVVCNNIMQFRRIWKLFFCNRST